MCCLLQVLACHALHTYRPRRSRDVDRIHRALVSSNVTPHTHRVVITPLLDVLDEWVADLEEKCTALQMPRKARKALQGGRGGVPCLLPLGVTARYDCDTGDGLADTEMKDVGLRL